VPLDAEISGRIQSTMEIAADTYDDTVARDLITNLNVFLAKQNIVGETVRIYSDSLIWMNYKPDSEGFTLESVFDASVLKTKTITGTFLGIEELSYQGYRCLVYKVNVKQGEDYVTFYSVSAPIDESQITIESSIIEDEDEKNIILAEQFQVLAEIEDPLFREELRTLMENCHKEDALELSASFVKEIGRATTWMMAHPEVCDDERRKRSILVILSMVFEREEVYVFEGDEFIVDDIDEDTRSLTVKKYESYSVISGVCVVNDYAKNDNGTLVFKDTYQPALIMLDNDEEQHYVTLNSLSYFSGNNIDDCDVHRERFLLKYPDLMSK